MTALFPVPREPDIDSYVEPLTDMLKSCVATGRPRRQRPWFNRSCKLAAVAQYHARQLAEHYPGMRPLCTLLKVIYRRIFESALRQYLEREEYKLLLQASKEPHKWL